MASVLWVVWHIRIDWAHLVTMTNIHAGVSSSVEKKNRWQKNVFSFFGGVENVTSVLQKFSAVCLFGLLCLKKKREDYAKKLLHYLT